MAHTGEQSVLRSVSPLKTQMARRLRQISRLVRTEGFTAVSDRIRRVAAQHLAPARSISPVRPDDIMAIDLLRPPRYSIPAVHLGEPLTANWVITPPALGSGGHTTLFRMIRYLEAHGYRNRVYFYDPYGGDHVYYKSIVRDYYNFHGPVTSVEQGMEDAHMVFATSWPTAYPVFNSRCAGKRFYFIQDYEPFFYPVGSTSCLAENTYRMGFHGISIGRCFSAKITEEFGMSVESFQYGCDTSEYSRSPAPGRYGVVFYARRDNTRRGMELGLMALKLFAGRNPEIAIHIYGDRIGKQSFSFIDHGRLTPSELNLVYNSCYAGLALSFTNVSLVPLEMLASGCIPVVNDSPYARMDLKNPYIAYAAPYPQALSAQLEAVIATQDFDFLSSAAAASVHATTWEEAGSEVDQILRRVLCTSAISTL